MREEDIQLALQMVAKSTSAEDENDVVGATISPTGSPKPLRKTRVLNINERRKQFRWEQDRERTLKYYTILYSLSAQTTKNTNVCCQICIQAAIFTQSFVHFPHVICIFLTLSVRWDNLIYSF